MDATDTGIYAREIAPLDRIVQVGIASGRVISLSFPGDVGSEVTHGHDLLDRIERYAEGSTERFEDVPIALTVPTDHRAVLERVGEIPYAETTDVMMLARTTPGLDADEDGPEIVRAALEGNPVPILIPAHRVTDGPSALPGDLDRRLRSIESGA